MTNNKNLRAVLFAIACLPVIVAFVFHQLGPRPAEAKSERVLPALAFHSYLIDLGSVEAEQYSRVLFRFQNRSDRPVTIKELSGSCGCLTPRSVALDQFESQSIYMDKTEFAPGEAGLIIARVEQANQKPGEKEYTIDVHYSDPESYTEKLIFRLELPEKKVTIRPQSLVIYQLGEESTVQNVTITDFRDKPIEVTGIESTSEFVTANILRSEFDNEGLHQTIVQVTVAGKVPPDRSHARAIVSTSDPEYPTLTIPLLIQGRDPRP